MKTMYLKFYDHDLHTELKILAAKLHITLQDLVTNACEKYLNDFKTAEREVEEEILKFRKTKKYESMDAEKRTVTEIALRHNLMEKKFPKRGIDPDVAESIKEMGGLKDPYEGFE